MNREKVLVVAVVSLLVYTLGISFFNSAISSLQTQDKISSSGAVKAIGVSVYSDADCTNRLSSIDWGVLEPDESKNVISYIRNEGNSAVTVSLSTENWSPSNASSYITLSWDYSGQSINPNEAIEVTFTLAVSASVSGITDFSFDIVIVGSG